jgi:hypothetical protein
MIRVVLKDIVEKPITGEWGDEGGRRAGRGDKPAERQR